MDLFNEARNLQSTYLKINIKLKDKEKIISLISRFHNLTKLEIENLEKYIILLLEYNQKINLIGKSTIDNIWERHILDSAQLMQFIPDKNTIFADLGSGAGLPGIILSILGVKKIYLIEKSFRKSQFLQEAAKISPNKIIILNDSLFDIDLKFDSIISRALAPMDKLLKMTDKLLKKDGFALFLKGKKLNQELIDAKDNLKQYQYKIFPSKSSEEGKIILLTKLIVL